MLGRNSGLRHFTAKELKSPHRPHKEPTALTVGNADEPLRKGAKTSPESNTLCFSCYAYDNSKVFIKAYRWQT